MFIQYVFVHDFDEGAFSAHAHCTQSWQDFKLCLDRYILPFVLVGFQSIGVGLMLVLT